MYQQTAGDSQKITAALIFAGELASTRFVSKLSRELRRILVWVWLVNDADIPDYVVLGGGVMRSYERMQSKIREIINKHDVIIPAADVRLQIAALGQQAGIYGAAKAAMNLFEETK